MIRASLGRRLAPLLVALPLVCVAPAPALAIWPGGGLPLCNTNYMFAQFLPRPAIVPDTSGGLFVIGDMITYVGHVCLDVRVDPSGATTAWPASGAAPPPGERLAVSDGQGGVLVAWSEPLGNGGRWWAGRWDANGMPAWSGGPVRLADSHPYMPWARLAADGAGGAFLAWLEDSSMNLLVQRVLGDGTTLSAEGVVVRPGPGWFTLDAIATDGTGGVILAWTDLGPNGFANSSDDDIYAQRVDGNLGVLWTANGVPVCASARAQALAAVASDGAGGAFVAWQDDRNDFGPDSVVANDDVYLQHLTASGEVAAGWLADGMLVNSEPGNQQSVRALPDGAGGVFLAWGGTSSHAQRIDASGVQATGWPAAGIEAGTVSASGFLGGLVPDHAGGIYVVWTVYGPLPAVRAQHWNAAGERPTGWPPDGIAIATGSTPLNVIALEALTDDHIGQLYAVLSTSTGGLTNRSYSRWVQHLGSDGVVAVELSLASAEAEPGVVRLRWFSSGDELKSATLERRLGQGAWTTRAELVPDGSGYLVFEDREVEAGVTYAYRLAYASDGALVRSPEVVVSVPRAFALALDPVSPNPAYGGVAIGLTLPSGATDARLELFDIAGRRIWTRSLDGAGAGRHVENLPPSIPAGVYRVVLAEARGTASEVVVLLR